MLFLFANAAPYHLQSTQYNYANFPIVLHLQVSHHNHRPRMPTRYILPVARMLGRPDWKNLPARCSGSSDQLVYEQVVCYHWIEHCRNQIITASAKSEIKMSFSPLE